MYVYLSCQLTRIYQRVYLAVCVYVYVYVCVCVCPNMPNGYIPEAAGGLMSICLDGKGYDNVMAKWVRVDTRRGKDGVEGEVDKGSVVLP